MALPFCAMANSTGQAFAPPPFRPSLTLIPPFGRYCRGSMAAYDLEKSLHGFFQVLQNCVAILHVAKPPLHGLFICWQVRRKTLHGFSQVLQNRCAILHVAKSPLHGLFICWQVRRKSLRGFFWVLQKCFALLHAAKRPSMGFLRFFKYKKIPPWIFQGLQNRCAILHVAKSPSMAL